MLEKLKNLDRGVDRAVRSLPQSTIDKIRQDYDDEDFAIIRWKQQMERQIADIKARKRHLEETFASYRKLCAKVLLGTAVLLCLNELWCNYERVPSTISRFFLATMDYGVLVVPLLGSFLALGICNLYFARQLTKVPRIPLSTGRRRGQPPPAGGWSRVVMEFFEPALEKGDDTVILSAKKLAGIIEREADLKVTAVQLGQWLHREQIFKKFPTGWLGRQKNK